MVDHRHECIYVRQSDGEHSGPCVCLCGAMRKSRVWIGGPPGVTQLVQRFNATTLVGERVDDAGAKP
jgi:hypothetical protein